MASQQNFRRRRSNLKLFTIGFTKTTAEHFFQRLKQSGTKGILDIRLHNASRLSGFAKRDDLTYFAKAICGIGYHHALTLAPTQAMFDKIKAGGTWSEYQRQFLSLMQTRHVEDMDREMLDGWCLLCAEDTPHFCHRRLVADYLAKKWGSVEIVHL